MTESDYICKHWYAGLNMVMTGNQQVTYEEMAVFYKVHVRRLATRCKKRRCVACGSSRRVARAFIAAGIEVFACRDCDVEEF